MNAPARYHHDDVGELTATDIPRIMGEMQRRANDHNPPAEVSGPEATTAKPITFPDPAPEDDPLPGWMVLFITGACALGGWLVLGGIAWLIVTSTDLQPLISLWHRVAS